MKKYFFGVVAVLLAVGFSAFKMPTSSKFVNVRVYFDPTKSPTSSTDVGATSNWSISTNGLTCQATNTKSCSFLTDENNIDDDGKLTGTLTVSGSIANGFYISAVNSVATTSRTFQP